MKTSLDAVITHIGTAYKGDISPDGRHYLEVDIGKQAQALGVEGLEAYAGVNAMVPLKEARAGMKVMIDGRTFVDYRQFASGVITPGYVAREAGLPHAPYIASDSMILNC